jgi:hypothetical protein
MKTALHDEERAKYLAHIANFPLASIRSGAHLDSARSPRRTSPG